MQGERDVSWKAAWGPTFSALSRAKALLKGGAVSKGGAALVKEGMTLGAKRNWLCAKARGTLHANFDDDDIYLPSYIARMAGALPRDML